MFFRKRTILEKKPGRVGKITEPMNAVEIAEIADLADITGGCAACGQAPARHGGDPFQQQRPRG